MANHQLLPISGHRSLTELLWCFFFGICGRQLERMKEKNSSSKVNLSLNQAASNTKVAQLRQLPPELKELLAQTRVPQVLLLTSAAMKPRKALDVSVGHPGTRHVRWPWSKTPCPAFIPFSPSDTGHAPNARLHKPPN